MVDRVPVTELVPSAEVSDPPECGDRDRVGEFLSARAAGATTTLPSRPGWHTYLDVFDGTIEVGDEPVGYTETALVTGGNDVAVTATEDATIVAFSIKPDTPITRQGTISR